MSFLINPYAYGGQAAYMARFDASTYLEHSGSPTGVVDGKEFTVAFWLANYDNTADGGIMQVGGELEVYFQRVSSSTARLRIFGYSGATIKLSAQSTSVISMPLGTTPMHFAISINMASTGQREVYIDGVSKPMTWDTYVNSTLGFEGSMSIMIDGAKKLIADVYDFWYDDARISLSSNISKFYNAGISPSLGADGSTPTGTPPLVYLNGYDNFANRGTGGDFTLTGTITQGAAAPL